MSHGLPDIRCVTLSKEDGEALWASAMKYKAERAERLPTEEACLREMFDCYTRLKELGWKEAMYAPRDGSPLEIVEPGSTGIHDGWRDENGRFWSGEEGWPMNTVLFRKRALPTPPSPRE